MLSTLAWVGTQVRHQLSCLTRWERGLDHILPRASPTLSRSQFTLQRIQSLMRELIHRRSVPNPLFNKSSLQQLANCAVIPEHVRRNPTVLILAPSQSQGSSLYFGKFRVNIDGWLLRLCLNPLLFWRLRHHADTSTRSRMGQWSLPSVLFPSHLNSIKGSPIGMSDRLRTKPAGCRLIGKQNFSLHVGGTEIRRVRTP